MKAKCDIVVVNDFAHINGGAGEVAISSAIELARQGYKVYFFAAVGPVDEQLSADGIEVICLDQAYIAEDPNPVRAAIQGIWNRKAESTLQDLLFRLRQKQTLVHVHGWGKALSASIFRAITNTESRGVVTFHSYEYACPNGGFYDFGKNEICHLEPMSKDCISCNCDKSSYSHKLWRVLRQKVQNDVSGLKSGDMDIICISDFSQQILGPYIHEKSDIYRVSNPINITDLGYQKPEESKTFIQVGRMDFVKGPHLLAEAAKTCQVPITFVGDGEMRKQIEDEYEFAEVTGWVDKQQVIEHLKSTRALVFPSLCYETQGLVILEAAALGIPSIVPDSSAASDMVEDQVSGLIFEGGNKEDLAEKIRAMEADDFVARLGCNAYKRYWENPSTIQNHVAELEKVYDQVLN
jgi:glycosyltransferase involved in cell wall biosynthesis